MPLWGTRPPTPGVQKAHASALVYPRHACGFTLLGEVLGGALTGSPEPGNPSHSAPHPLPYFCTCEGSRPTPSNSSLSSQHPQLVFPVCLTPWPTHAPQVRCAGPWAQPPAQALWPARDAAEELHRSRTPRPSEMRQRGSAEAMQDFWF